MIDFIFNRFKISRIHTQTIRNIKINQTASAFGDTATTRSRTAAAIYSIYPKQSPRLIDANRAHTHASPIKRLQERTHPDLLRS